MELFFRQFVIGVAAYGLPAGLFAFLLAWWVLKNVRSPGPSTFCIALAFLAGVIAYTAGASLVADSSIQFRTDGNIWFIAGTMFATSSAVLLFGPRRKM
jgi:hypothetical protein